MRLSSFSFQSFRCFDAYHLDVDSPLVVIEGENGVGKTSILEALYYACYLRSFRAKNTKELISFGKDGFFIRLHVDTDTPPTLSHEISIGFSHNKRLVKVDQKAISSYKDLMTYYKVLSLTEDDLALVQGGPQMRRLFIDQLLLLIDPDYGQILRLYRQVLNQRNALLNASTIDKDTYRILTEQLWQKTALIQTARQKGLHDLQKHVDGLCKDYFPQAVMLFSYCSKVSPDIPPTRLEESLYQQERRYRRSLFGAHLDDIAISYQNQSSRHFASRGQQKLIVVLLKVAQLQLLRSLGHAGIFLLDDFMTDFDHNKASILLQALGGLGNQLIFTSPSYGGFISDQLKSMGAHVSKLTY